MTPARKLKENRDCVVSARVGRGKELPRIRSNPCFSNIGFEIHYLCKQGLCSKSSVRVYTSICARDQVIENWSHLCKLYTNQEEYGSVTPGFGKETSSGIRHKAGWGAAAAAQEVEGEGGSGSGGGPRRKKQLHTMMAPQNFTPTKALLGCLKIF